MAKKSKQDSLEEQVAELKKKLADRVDKHDKDGKALMKAVKELDEVTRERDAYKKAKQENDDRFCGERDEARQEVESLKAELVRYKEFHDMAKAKVAELGKHRIQAPNESLLILADVGQERLRQEEKWGQQNHPDGTGDTGSHSRAATAKAVCDAMAKSKKLTWAHILTEEFMEALAEKEEVNLYTELVQVAAVAVSWAEHIKRRQSGRPL